MTDATLPLPDPDLRALVTGEVIVAFVAPGSVTPGSEVLLTGSGPRPEAELKPAYRRWARAAPPAGRWSATVEMVTTTAALDPQDGAARHVLTEPEAGDLVVLRVESTMGPVLSDDAFAARRASLEAALRA